MKQIIHTVVEVGKVALVVVILVGMLAAAIGIVISISFPPQERYDIINVSGCQYVHDRYVSVPLVHSGSCTNHPK